MTRHSKNNTASSVFTYAERQRLAYGTKRQRMGRDSLRSFDTCHLCLSPASTPVACPQGHIACRECAYEMLLAQTKDIAARRAGINEATERERRREEVLRLAREEKQREEFVESQTSLLSVVGSKGRSADAERAGDKLAMASFWVPGLMPAVDDASTAASLLRSLPKEAEMAGPVCMAGGTPHPISRKKLYPVHFHTESSNISEPKSISTAETNEPVAEDDDATIESPSRAPKMCPSCCKTLRNGTVITCRTWFRHSRHITLLVSKTCGHVFCGTCFTNFIAPVSRCSVCSKRCVAERDGVRLAGEGTGFAAAGGCVQVNKWDVAFQG